LATRAGASPGRLLVLSGWEPELAALRAALGARPALRRRLSARPAGVGLVDSGIGAARAIAEVKPRAVIFVGTAGIYPSAGGELAVGQAVLARRLLLVSSAALRKEAYFPRPLPVAVETDADLRRALARAARLPIADVACPTAITSARPAARRVAETTGCAAENLEAFAVGRAAVFAGLPFAAVLGLSNAVGPTAHDEWRAYAPKASAAACAAVIAHLAGDSLA
jgi:purine-nucleoside phosphorylase